MVKVKTSAPQKVHTSTYNRRVKKDIITQRKLCELGKNIKKENIAIRNEGETSRSKIYHPLCKDVKASTSKFVENTLECKVSDGQQHSDKNENNDVMNY